MIEYIQEMYPQSSVPSSGASPVSSPHNSLGMATPSSQVSGLSWPATPGTPGTPGTNKKLGKKLELAIAAQIVSRSLFGFQHDPIQSVIKLLE